MPTSVASSRTLASVARPAQPSSSSQSGAEKGDDVAVAHDAQGEASSSECWDELACS